MSFQLSIIIPVYNVEHYVQECLESVFRQIPERVEIIVVNDGSPDRSMAIIRREFQEWISSGVLVLLEQENKGPGGARNFGLEYAKGKYIGFLDSDDVLLDGYFDELMGHIDLGAADIIEFGFKRFTDSSAIVSEPYNYLYTFSGVVNLTDVRNQVFARTRWFPSLRVYRRNVLEGFKFKEYVHYEDLISLPSIFMQDWLVNFIDRPLLGYRKRQGSITSIHKKTQVDELYKFYNSLSIDDATALNILKLSLARGLAYYYCEFGSPKLQFEELISDAKKIRINHKIGKNLTWPDWLFYMAPRLYIMVNKLRIVKKV